MPIEKIIVVEDDLIVRKSLEQQLRNRRYDVASASTIAAAQEFLTKDNFDLMIVDVRLPTARAPTCSSSSRRGPRSRWW